MKRGEIWWADLGAYRAREQTGRRPVIVWQSDTLTRLLESVLVVPLTTNLDRAKLAGTALISASDGGLAVSAGARLDSEPVHQPYGQREYGARDLSPMVVCDSGRPSTLKP